MSQLKCRRWFDSTFQMNVKFGFRQSFYKSIKFHKLLTNPTQMRILKRVFVFQAVAHHAVKAGVTEQNLRRSEMIIDLDAVFHQPRRGVIYSAHIILSFQDLDTGIHRWCVVVHILVSQFLSHVNVIGFICIFRPMAFVEILCK